jgi:raffinose/stachyose/melibiose transport system substrate-binding protein
MSLIFRFVICMLVLTFNANLLVAAAPPQQDKVVITIWGENVQEELRSVILDGFVKSFNDAHPNIEIDYQFVETQWDSTRTALQAGSGPDIIVSPGPAFVLELVNAGAVLPLNEYAEQYGWQEIIQPWAYNSGVSNEQLWALPLTYESMLLYYNVTQFEANNWKVPTTRAELEALCESVHDAGKWCFSHSNQFWKGVNEWLVSVVYNNYVGADKVYEALTGQRQWTDPLFVESVQLLANWAKNGWFSGSVENYFSFNYDDHMANFCSGQAVMNIEGSWAFQTLPSYCEGLDEWDWAPISPLRDGVDQSYVLAIGTTVSINAQTQHPDEAAAVIDWLYNDAARAAQIAQGFNFAEFVVPIEYDVADFEGADERVVRYIDAISEAASEGRTGYTTWSFWPARTDQDIIQNLDLVFTDQMSAEEYMQIQQDTFSQEMSEGKVLPVPSTEVTTP